MIVGVNQKDRINLIKMHKRLNGFRFCLINDGGEVLDYLDYFEYNFLPEAQNSLPKREQKIYLARQAQLIDKLPKITENALASLDKRKIYSGIKKIHKDTKEFIDLAFTGYESVDMKPIELLIDAEYHAIVSRIIYNATHEEQEEM